MLKKISTQTSNEIELLYPGSYEKLEQHHLEWWNFGNISSKIRKEGKRGKEKKETDWHASEWQRKWDISLSKCAISLLGRLPKWENVLYWGTGFQSYGRKYLHLNFTAAKIIITANIHELPLPRKIKTPPSLFLKVCCLYATQLVVLGYRSLN